MLSKFEFQRNNGHATREDHKLGVVITASLAGPQGISVAQSLCRKFLSAAAKHEIRAYDFNALIKGLLQVHPVPMLDELFSGDMESRKESVHVLNSLRRFHHPVLDVVPDEVLLGWCDRDPALRNPFAAAVATLFKEPHEWMPLTGKLLEKTPDPGLVLNEIIRRLNPPNWNGSLATKLEGRLKLLNSMPGSEIPGLAAKIVTERPIFKQTLFTNAA